MDSKKLFEKLAEMQSTVGTVQSNKNMIGFIINGNYSGNISSGLGRCELTADQRKTVNHLIVSLLEQNNAEMEQELKPLADLLDTQK